MTDLCEKFMQLMLDLDRCQHGRHKADPCFGCPSGQSAGNLLIPPGTLIGSGISGAVRIVVPDPEHRYDPAAWVVPDSEELQDVARAAAHSQSLIRLGTAALAYHADPDDLAAGHELMRVIDDHQRAFPKQP